MSNVLELADWMVDQHASAREVIRLVEKPQDYETQWQEYQLDQTDPWETKVYALPGEPQSVEWDDHFDAVKKFIDGYGLHDGRQWVSERASGNARVHARRSCQGKIAGLLAS